MTPSRTCRALAPLLFSLTIPAALAGKQPAFAQAPNAWPFDEQPSQPAEKTAVQKKLEELYRRDGRPLPDYMVDPNAPANVHVPRPGTQSRTAPPQMQAAPMPRPAGAVYAQQPANAPPRGPVQQQLSNYYAQQGRALPTTQQYSPPNNTATSQAGAAATAQTAPPKPRLIDRLNPFKRFAKDKPAETIAAEQRVAQPSYTTDRNAPSSNAVAQPRPYAWNRSQRPAAQQSTPSFGIELGSSNSTMSTMTGQAPVGPAYPIGTPAASVAVNAAPAPPVPVAPSPVQQPIGTPPAPPAPLTSIGADAMVRPSATFDPLAAPTAQSPTMPTAAAPLVSNPATQHAPPVVSAQPAGPRTGSPAASGPAPATLPALSTEIQAAPATPHGISSAAPVAATPAVSPDPQQMDSSNAAAAKPAQTASTEDGMNPFNEVSESEADQKASPYTGLTLDDESAAKALVSKMHAAANKSNEATPPAIPLINPPSPSVKTDGGTLAPQPVAAGAQPNAAPAHRAAESAAPTIHPRSPEPAAADLSRSTAVYGSARGTAAKMRRIGERVGERGLKGFCPVALRDQRDLLDGQPQFHSTYESKTYYFSSLDAKRRFDQNPAKYAPVACGIDIVVKANSDQILEGSLDFSAWYRDRLYLFTSPESLEAFSLNPGGYASQWRAER